jgi:flagellar protein FliO/FliZ
MTATTLAPFAAAGAPVTLESAGGLLRVVLALMIVLVAVLGTAWMSRRMRGLTPARGRSLEVLGQLALGPRERAVLIRVGDQQLLLGVAAGSVSKLHVLEHAPSESADCATVAADTAERPSFKALLMRSLGK